MAAKFVCGKGRESLGRARHQLEESNVAAQFRKNPKYRIFEPASPGYSYIGFNGKKSEFAADVAVRKAIAHCIDRPKIVRLALEGAGVPMNGAVSPIYKDFVKSKSEYPAFNIEAAKKVL